MIEHIHQTKIPGCVEILPRIFKDERGSFVKVFHQGLFNKNGLQTHFTEEYYSVSRRGVLRGMHFQVPPMDHVKLVYCISGEVLDVVVDLRVNSPTYKLFEVFNLSAEKGNLIYIPKGLAHGFYVLSQSASIVYKVSTTYSPEHDSGILWGSAGVPWPDDKPIVSKRDSGFLPLCDYNSPFRYEANDGR